jgi:hypothetical protein
MNVFGGLTDVSNTLMKRRGAGHCIGFPLTFSLFTRDKFSNFRTSGGEDVQVFVIAAAAGIHGVSNILDRRTGEYVVSVQYFNYENVSNFSSNLAVVINGLAVPGSPFPVSSSDGLDVDGIFCNSPVCGGSMGDADAFSFVGNSFPFRDSNAGDGLRLTDNAPDQTGAVWLSHKQRVTLGWSLEFTFRMWDRSLPCDVCQPAGAEGFAFVIQNSDMGVKALGRGSSGLGYSGIENSVAVEFDTW